MHIIILMCIQRRAKSSWLLADALDPAQENPKERSSHSRAGLSSGTPPSLISECKIIWSKAPFLVCCAVCSVLSDITQHKVCTVRSGEIYRKPTSGAPRVECTMMIVRNTSRTQDRKYASLQAPHLEAAGTLTRTLYVFGCPFREKVSTSP
jgi:hypothetical protein